MIAPPATDSPEHVLMCLAYLHIESDRMREIEKEQSEKLQKAINSARK